MLQLLSKRANLPKTAHGLKREGYMLVETVIACLTAAVFTGAAVSCALMSAKLVMVHEIRAGLPAAKRALITELGGDGVSGEFVFGNYRAHKVESYGNGSKWMVFRAGDERHGSYVFWPE